MAVATPTETRAASANARARFRLWPLADGYIVGSVAGATVRSIGWFAGLFLAFAFVQAARTVAVSDVPMAIALQSLALQLPRIVLFTIPASLLYGTVATFTEMSGRGEITAFMGGGMSLWRMMRTPLIFALFLTGFAFWLQEVVVPDFELRKSNLAVSAAVQILQSQKFKPLVDFRDDGTVERIVQAEKFDPIKRAMIAPTIQLFRPDGTVEIEIKARSAAWDARQKAWVFRDSITRTAGENGAAPIVARARQSIIQTAQVPAPDKFEQSEKSACDQIDKQNYEMVSWRQLDAYRAEKLAALADSNGDNRGLKKEIRRETYGIHDKFATPLIVMAMVLVGVPLGVRPARTASAGVAMGVSLVVILGYYLLWTFCTQWGKGGGDWPIFAAYLPLLILTLTGTVLLIRKS